MKVFFLLPFCGGEKKRCERLRSASSKDLYERGHIFKGVLAHKYIDKHLIKCFNIFR